MDSETVWRVHVLEDDVLLFHLNSGGTVTMRVIPAAEWEARAQNPEIDSTVRPGAHSTTEGLGGAAAKVKRWADVGSPAGVARKL